MERRERQDPIQLIRQDLQLLQDASSRVPLARVRQGKGDIYGYYHRDITESVWIESDLIDIHPIINIRNLSVRDTNTKYAADSVQRAVLEGRLGRGDARIDPDEQTLEIDLHVDRRTTIAVQNFLKKILDDPEHLVAAFKLLETEFSFNGKPQKSIILPISIEDDREVWNELPSFSKGVVYKMLDTSLEPSDIELVNYYLSQAKSALQPWMKK